MIRQSECGDSLDTPTDQDRSQTHRRKHPSRRTLLQTGLTALLIGGSVGSISNRVTAEQNPTSATSQSGDLSPQQQVVSPPEQFTAPLWSTQFDGDVSVGQFDDENGAVYLTTRSETSSSPTQLRSVDLQSGRERWSSDVPFSDGFPPFPRTPGSPIVIEAGSTVASYEPSSGRQRWQTQYTREGASPEDINLSYPTDSIFLLADETDNITQNKLVGIDRQTGEVQWETTVDLPGEQQNVDLPFFISGSTGLVMLATAQGHRILELDPSTGDINQQYTAPVADQLSSGEFPFASLRSQENFVTIESSARIDGSRLEVVRAFNSIGEVENQPEAVISGQEVRELFSVTNTDETTAYAVTTEQQLRAVALPTTETLWEVSIPGEVTEEYARQTASRIYTRRFTPTSDGGFDGEVVARSNSTGEEQWARTVVENVGVDRTNPPFLRVDELGENQLAVQQTNGVVISLDKASGETGQWGVSLPGDGQDLSDFRFNVETDSNVVVGEVNTGTFETPETSVSVFPTPSGDDSGSLEQLSVSLSESSIPAGSGEQSELTIEVTDAATGGGVSGATVSVSDLGLSATTDTAGTATLSLTDATPGEYTLSVSVENYTTASKTLTVTDSDSEPDSVVDEYDTDNNGIGIVELGEAGRDFASGELTIGELGQIGAAFAS